MTSLTELATAALADTKQRGPTLCHQCEKEPAVCTGIYEDGDEHPACDKCCGHGNEDGWCVGIKPSIREPLLAAGYLADLATAREALREACDYAAFLIRNRQVQVDHAHQRLTSILKKGGL